ncbi:MAG TPA: hypothetical protein VK158_04865 [Acidobacteriota bacterium]|nr:hypothetical protein [Acidobacteriota bacterium]
MNVDTKSLKLGEIVVEPQTLDDLWTLSTIIEPSDHVSGGTIRKIKLGSSDDRSQKITIRHLVLTIKVEKVQYEPSTKQLRISGPITDASPDIPKGDYHTFALEERTKITIKKETWPSYALQKLKEATTTRGAALVVLFDGDHAVFGQTSRQGWKELSSLHNARSKKAADTESSFYTDIAQRINNIDEQMKPSIIFICSPHFWREYLLKALETIASPARKKVKTVEVSSTDPSVITELVKSEEFANYALEQSQKSIISVFDDILSRIAKDGLATYGKDNVIAAISTGAIDTLLIANESLAAAKEQGEFPIVQENIKLIESQHGKVHIVEESSTVHDRLVGLGGFAATLRFKVE